MQRMREKKIEKGMEWKKTKIETDFYECQFDGILDIFHCAE